MIKNISSRGAIECTNEGQKAGSQGCGQDKRRENSVWYMYKSLQGVWVYILTLV